MGIQKTLRDQSLRRSKLSNPQMKETQTVISSNYCFIFPAVTLMILEEAGLLNPPHWETSKTVKQSVMCNLHSQEDCDV